MLKHTFHYLLVYSGFYEFTSFVLFLQFVMEFKESNLIIRLK